MRYARRYRWHALAESGAFHEKALESAGFIAWWFASGAVQ